MICDCDFMVVIIVVFLGLKFFEDVVEEEEVEMEVIEILEELFEGEE